MSYVERGVEKARQSFLYLVASMVIVFAYYAVPPVAYFFYGYPLEKMIERVLHLVPDALSLTVCLYASFWVYKQRVKSQTEKNCQSYYYDRVEIFAALFNIVFLYANVFGNVVHRIEDLVVFYKEGHSEHFEADAQKVWTDVLLDGAFILFNMVSVSLVFANINVDFRPRDMMKEFYGAVVSSKIKTTVTKSQMSDEDDKIYLQVSPHAVNLSSYCLHVFYHCFSAFISIMMVLFSKTSESIDVSFLMVEFMLIALSSAFIVLMSVANLLECFRYMMHSTTGERSTEVIARKIEELGLPGLQGYHELHIWLLKPGWYEGSIHVVFGNEEEYLRGARRLNDLFVASNINMAVQPEFAAPLSVDRKKVTDVGVCDLDCGNQLSRLLESKGQQALPRHGHCGSLKCCHH